jgi:branched-chain amino acid transport system permease protein
VIGGKAFVTAPWWGAAVGSIVLVVAVGGGMGSLVGAFIASLLIGCIQTFAVTLDISVTSLLGNLGITLNPDVPLSSLWNLTIAQVAPVLPYLLLVLMLIFRPRGLMGTREG